MHSGDLLITCGCIYTTPRLSSCHWLVNIYHTMVTNLNRSATHVQTVSRRCCCNHEFGRYHEHETDGIPCWRNHGHTPPLFIFHFTFISFLAKIRKCSESGWMGGTTVGETTVIQNQLLCRWTYWVGNFKVWSLVTSQIFKALTTYIQSHESVSVVLCLRQSFLTRSGKSHRTKSRCLISGIRVQYLLIK